MKDKDYKMLEEAYKKVNKKTTKKKDEDKVKELAKQDPREVEGYSKSEESDTYKEARSFGGEPWHSEEQWDHDKEWHGLGAKTPKAPSMADLIQPSSNKEMQDVDLGGGMKKSMPVYSLSNSIIDALDEHGDVNYKDLAKAIAVIFKREYESSELPADKFIEEFKREINTRKQ